MHNQELKKKEKKKDYKYIIKTPDIPNKRLFLIPTKNNWRTNQVVQWYALGFDILYKPLSVHAVPGQVDTQQTSQTSLRGRPYDVPTSRQAHLKSPASEVPFELQSGGLQEMVKSQRQWHKDDRRMFYAHITYTCNEHDNCLWWNL